ncbi:hypothetical protein ACHAWF_015181 [Thalassiosira exigua]
MLVARSRLSAMGALKHVVLPLCVLSHAVAIGIFTVSGKEFMAEALDWPRATAALTPIERHLLGAGFTFHVVLVVNDVAAILVENAHYRGMATFLEFLLYAGDLVDAVYENALLSEGAEKAFTLVPLAVMSAVTLLGLVVHSQEPGLFTKDKNVGAKKKK